MNLDPSIALALAVHAHKGVYALLLGSGISRAAGIPTGWEVVKNLIRRVATLEDKDPGEEAEKWYRKRYGKEPNYSELLEVIAPTPPERTSLLREFFEPTEQQKEEGLKIPTKAHLAIARLVSYGYLKVIVTTNFDRLLEQAIEGQGVSPTVVSTSHQIAGMMPLPHVPCLIVKVNGDYRDTRIKNTTAELASYDADTNALLDRVFSEYGLIVCGWSGEWDQALADAIARNTRHRFSTFWMTLGQLTDKATDQVKHRQAVIIQIVSADQAFIELEDRIAALEERQLEDPRSPQIALARMKKYLSEDRYRIQLHDFVLKELEEVHRASCADREAAWGFF